MAQSTAPADALAARSKQGSDAMEAGRFEDAAAIYRELVAALPNEAGLHMNLGMALAMGGHEADAVAPLERAIKLQPTLMPAQLFLGTTFLSLGKPQSAIAPLRRVVTARPADAESRSLLGQALLAAGRPIEATTQFEKLTALAPREPGAWSLLAEAYNGIVQTTLDTFERSAGEDAWRTLLLADALRDDGRLAAAFGVYRRALGQLPNTRAVHDGLAAVYELSGHADWAAEQRARGAKIALDCTVQIAECAVAKGRHADALTATAKRVDPASRYWRIRAAAALTKAAFARIEALPDSRERRVMRAELARSRGQHVESVAELKAALAFTPDDPALLAELALSSHLARDYEQAIAVERQLLARTPDDASTLSLYGQSLLELQRIDEAIPALERAVAQRPDDQAARGALGRAYVQKGNMASAIPLLEPALAGDEEGLIHFQLARAYQATGQTDKAKPLLEKYQALQQARRERDGATESAIVAPGHE
jgi:predicted Zn-dependent protease